MLRSEDFPQKAVREQLERILSSADFQASASLCAFLRFVVEETLAGRHSQIKAYTVAVHAFNRPSDFDAQNDAIVRVQARRLRRALRYYYATDGAQDSIFVEIPVGTYVPIFRRNDARAKAVEGAEPHAIPAPSHSPASLPRGPSILVLPFEVLTDEEDYVYSVDGLVADLVVALTRFPGFLIIGPLSRDRLKGQSSESRAIGRRYGVQFVLRGNIRKRGDLARISVRLIDVATGGTLWADSFDSHGDVVDLFELEDIVVSQVAAILADDFGVIPRVLTQHAIQKRIGSIETYDAVLRYYHFVTRYTREAWLAAREALELAVQLDPTNALTLAMLAVMIGEEYEWSSGSETRLRQAIGLAQRAVALDPQCQYARLVRAYFFFDQRQREQFLSETEQAIRLNPNNAHVIAVCGLRLGLVGEWEQGLGLMTKAIRLNPHHPGWYHLLSATNHYRLGQYREALTVVLRINSPELVWDPLCRAAVLGQLGRIREARDAVRELLDLKPNFASNGRKLLRRWVFLDETVDMLWDGLRKAGLEENT